RHCVSSAPADLFGACSIVASVFFSPASVHSGARPEIWCYLNLHRIDEAKELVARENGLTNGATITSEDISPHINRGFSSLQCVEHGKYIIGPVGTEPHCSIHGSLREIGETRLGEPSDL